MARPTRTRATRGGRGARLGARTRATRGGLRRSLRARTTRTAVQRARGHLRAFRKATILTVAITSFLLLFAPDGGTRAQEAADSVRAEAVDSLAAADSAAVADSVATADTATLRPDSLARESAREAGQTLRGLWYSIFGGLPKLVVALGIFLVAGLLLRMLRPILRRLLGNWARADAFTALTGVVTWMVAVAVAASVLAGDIRALLGSLGLIGLALSWALQSPIESFTGWLLNSLRGYYRVGDRIAVGDVFGDVYRIDFLTTTVWEYGGPDRPTGWIRAEQPTGRLITFPNNEVLTGTVVNYTRDFPWVWDELAVAVAPESDLRFALDTVRAVALETLGEYMAEPAERYRIILMAARLDDAAVSNEPEVYLGLTESGAEVVVRYLVQARQKRRWKSELSLRVMEEFGRPENRERILPLFPRQQVQWIGRDGVPLDRAPGAAGDDGLA